MYGRYTLYSIRMYDVFLSARTYRKVHWVTTLARHSCFCKIYCRYDLQQLQYCSGDIVSNVLTWAPLLSLLLDSHPTTVRLSLQRRSGVQLLLLYWKGRRQLLLLIPKNLSWYWCWDDGPERPTCCKSAYVSRRTRVDRGRVALV